MGRPPGAADRGRRPEAGAPRLDDAQPRRPDAVRSATATPPSTSILLTAKTNRADVVEGLDAGADDYLVKPFDPEELRARIEAGIRIVDLQQRLADKVTELEGAIVNVRTLRGLIPICSYCKTIRDDSDYWHRVEEYVTEHSDAKFNHSICPSCLRHRQRGGNDRGRPAVA